MSKVVLSGYYGFNNAGDELILYSIIKTLRELEPDISITVLSKKPEKTAKQYEVQAVNRWRLFSLTRAIASSELLISGGGSLFQDVTSANSPLYYWMIIFLAKLMGKKTMIYSQGIGPLQRPRNRKMLAWLFNRLSKITVRDEGAKSDLLAMGVNKEIIVTADPVLGISPRSIEAQLGREILERSGLELIVEQRLLGVFIRSWEDNSYLPELVKACDRLALEGWQVVFVPMQFPHDIAIAKQATKLMTHETGYLKEMYDPAEMLAITKNFDLIIGMRLHSLINAAVVGVPLVGISYDPKIDRFLQQIGQQSLNTVHDLNSETLVQLVNWVHNNREEIQADMEKSVKLLYQKAWKSARIAMELWRN